ncbi:MAG: sigma-70 family RNA polymerase sigma factor [Actinomycetota bacterium]
MSAGVEDGALARRAADGDDEAFAELVRRHEARVYSIALRMTGRQEDARDAAQDAFVTAYRKLSSFRGDAAFTTWLHRVTVNATYDLLRKRSRTPEPVAEVPEPVAASHIEDPAGRVAERLEVRDALALVPEEFRAVLVLRDMEDLPVEEVAEILGLPVGTVKSRCHRARVALGRILAGETERAGTSEASEGTTKP